MPRILLIVMLTMAFAGVSRGEIMMGDTVEWLTHRSALVVVAAPLETEVEHAENDVWLTRTRLRIVRVIKGPLTEGDSFTLHQWSWKAADPSGLGSEAAKRSEFVVFASVQKNTSSAGGK